MKSGIAGSREGSGGGDSVDSGYEEYEEDYRWFESQTLFTCSYAVVTMIIYPGNYRVRA